MQQSFHSLLHSNIYSSLHHDFEQPIVWARKSCSPISANWIEDVMASKRCQLPLMFVNRDAGGSNGPNWRHIGADRHGAPAHNSLFGGDNRVSVLDHVESEILYFWQRSIRLTTALFTLDNIHLRTIIDGSTMKQLPHIKIRQERVKRQAQDQVDTLQQTIGSPRQDE